jgi:hypothetical protein
MTTPKNDPTERREDDPISQAPWRITRAPSWVGIVHAAFMRVPLIVPLLV